MTETNEQITEGVDGFFDRLNDAVDILTEKLIEISPEAADALLNLVWVKGVFGLASAVAALVLFFGILVFFYRLWRVGFTDQLSVIEANTAAFVFGGAGALGSGLLVIKIFFHDFLNFYTWLSIFYPEGALAYKALQAVGIDL